MKNTLVLVADLGCLKAFKLQDGEINHTPRLEPVEEYAQPEAHERIVEEVTDMSGRFHRGTTKSNAAGAMSDGERHNLELEKRKRLIRQLATHVNRLAKDEKIEQCWMAASREINQPLQAELDPEVRAKMQTIIAADLTKLGRSEILKHF
jgi:hypothetical protein